MSIAGVRQLKTLIVRYCEYGGSSKGARMFIETQLPKIKEDNPDLKVRVEKVNGKHPILVGQYLAVDRKRQVCIKNIAPEEIAELAFELRNQWGGKAKSWNCRQWTHFPSVQGQWTSFFKVPSITVEVLPARVVQDDQ